MDSVRQKNFHIFIRMFEFAKFPRGKVSLLVLSKVTCNFSITYFQRCFPDTEFKIEETVPTKKQICGTNL